MSEKYKVVGEFVLDDQQVAQIEKALAAAREAYELLPDLPNEICFDTDLAYSYGDLSNVIDMLEVTAKCRVVHKLKRDYMADTFD